MTAINFGSRRAEARCTYLCAAFVLLGAALSSCSGGETPLGSGGPSTPVATTQVASWGDSTTSGVGASNSDLSYPAQLQSLTGRDTFNGGVSGQTSDQIAARQGGAPALLTFVNNTLPDSGLAIVESQSTFPVSAEGPGPITGTIGGVHGTLSYQNGPGDSPQLAFSQDQMGTATIVPAQSPFYPDTFGREAQINIFWMGQNNFYDSQGIKSDFIKSIAFLSSNKFIVMSLLNAGDEGIGTDSYNMIAQINADLAQSYPENYMDIRGILISNYDPTNPQDVLDHDNDVPPSSLRNDNDHLNDKGYRLVAQQNADFIAAKGW